MAPPLLLLVKSKAASGWRKIKRTFKAAVHEQQLQGFRPFPCIHSPQPQHTRYIWPPPRPQPQPARCIWPPPRPELSGSAKRTAACCSPPRLPVVEASKPLLAPPPPLQPTTGCHSSGVFTPDSHTSSCSSSSEASECCSSLDPFEALAAGVAAVQAHRVQRDELSNPGSFASSCSDSSATTTSTQAVDVCACQRADPSEASCSDRPADPSHHSISSLRCRATSWPDEHVGMPAFFTQPPTQPPLALPSSLALERTMYSHRPRLLQPLVRSSEDCQIVSFWEQAGCTAQPSAPTQAERSGVSMATSPAPEPCTGACTAGAEEAELQFSMELDEQPAVASPVPAAVPVSPESAERVAEDARIAAHYPSGRPFALAAEWDPMVQQQVVQLLTSDPVVAQLLIDAAQKREGMLAHAGAVKLQLPARKKPLSAWKPPSLMTPSIAKQDLPGPRV